MATVADRIRAFILDDVLEPGTATDLTNETRLWDEELIDSMGIMMLIAHIESEYDVDIEVEDVDVEHFKTVNRIAALVERKLS